MSRLLKFIGCMSAGILLLGAGSTFAADSGLYAGGSIGYSDSSIDGDDIDPNFTGNVDDTDTGWRVMGGFQLNPNFALEGGFLDLGDYSASGTANGAAATASLEIDGWQAAAIGRFPVSDRVGIFGKVGAFVWDADAGGAIGAAVGTISDDGTDVMFGAGLDIALGQNVSLRGEWERFQTDPAGSDVDFDFWSASLLFYLPQ